MNRITDQTAGRHAGFKPRTRRPTLRSIQKKLTPGTYQPLVPLSSDEVGMLNVQLQCAIVRGRVERATRLAAALAYHFSDKPSVWGEPN